MFAYHWTKIAVRYCVITDLISTPFLKDKILGSLLISQLPMTRLVLDIVILERAEVIDLEHSQCYIVRNIKHET